MRSADLPTAPFFRELRAEKERSKEALIKHLVTFDSELRRLKSNKKPILNGSCYVSQQKAIFD